MQSSPKKRARIVTAIAIPEDVFYNLLNILDFTPGSIMQVKFYKFMCYDNEQTPFILNLKPGLTVIHGQNGSGKSTIVDALQFCFGVTASQTDRASKLGEFVSHGHVKGAASVVLCNKLSSEGGFKPYYEEVFGSYILIGREATRSGQITYHFDSEYVSLVENDLLVIKKEAKRIEDRLQRSIEKYINFIRSNAELTYREVWRKIVDDICNHYSIQITNPLLVLKQNMAKTFINGSDKEKYEFLQQVMKTEKIESDINKAAEELKDAENDLKEVEEMLGSKTKEVQNRQLMLRKVKEAGGQDILAKQVSNARHRVNKAHLKQNNIKIEDKKKKIDKYKNLEKELIDKMNKDEEESKVRESKAQSIVKLCNEASYKVDTLSAERKRMYYIYIYYCYRVNEISAHKRRYQDNIKDLERNLLMLDRDIRTKKAEMRKIQSQSSNTKEISERIDKLESEIDILEKTKSQKITDLEQKEEKYKIQKALSDNCVKELTQLQSEMNQLKNKERDITEIINRIPQDKIQEASKALSGKIKGKIIWPVSAYVRVKPEYEKYTALIETKMKSCLDSAVISDNNDRPLIRAICQERKIPEPNITSIPGTNSDEVQTNYFQDDTYDIISFLDTLDFSALDAYHRAILKIYFSDVMKFDQILLCSDDLKAETFLKNQGVLQGKKNTSYLFPQGKQIDGMTKKFREILTLREKKLTCTFGDLQSQYSAIHQAVTMLNQKKGADLDECKRKQKEYNDELAKKQKQYNEKKIEKNQVTNMLINFEKEIDKTKEENRITIRKLEDKISEKNECEDQLKEAQQGSGSKIDQLDAQITDKESDVNRVKEQLEEQKNKEQNDSELTAMDEKRLELCKEIEDLQEEIKKYTGQLQELQAKNAEYNKELEEDEGKKKSLMIKLTSLNAEIETLRRENGPYELSKNYNIEGGEIRTPQEEIDEYNLLKQKLDQIQDSGLPSLTEAEAELDKVQMEQIELETKYRQNLDIKNDLQLQIDPRKQDLLAIRDSVSDTCQIKMMEYMMKFRSAATVTIDWDNKKVLLEIQPRADETEDNATKDINQLSGGEKTRTTLCFFLSLLDQIKTPFLVMDEIDVFMDDYSRNKSYELILEVARNSKRQMILLTPKEIDQVQLKTCLINLERKSLI